MESLPIIDERWACPRCGAPFGHLVCTECWQQEPAFEAALAVGVFAAPLSRAVVLHKDAGERRLAAVLGGLLGTRVRTFWPGWTERVVYVPASPTALTRRGFDHGAALATEVAKLLGAPALGALAASSARDQRSLGRGERARNVSDVFSVGTSVSGRVLLVDDVMTTGATVDAAADALLRAGALAVRVAAVARAW